MNKQLFKVFRGEDIVAHKFGNCWYFSGAVGMNGGFYDQFGDHITPESGEIYHDLCDRSWDHQNNNITISGEIFLSPEKGCHVKADGWDPSDNMW